MMICGYTKWWIDSVEVEFASGSAFSLCLFPLWIDCFFSIWAAIMNGTCTVETANMVLGIRIIGMGNSAGAELQDRNSGEPIVIVRRKGC